MPSDNNITENAMGCECAQWTRADPQKVLTKHHPYCPRYDPAGDAKEIIDGLLDGIRAWASDEDGVHPDLWDNYVRACIFAGQPCPKEADHA